MPEVHKSVLNMSEANVVMQIFHFFFYHGNVKLKLILVYNNTKLNKV